MNHTDNTSRVQQYMKHLGIAVLAIVGLVVGWFAVVRLSSPWTVVKTVTRVQESARTSGSVETLRVGCYNIAHGRGGKFGASNWDGGSRTEKIQRLKQIGQLLHVEDLDIVVLNEVDFSSIWSGHIDQAMVIAEEAGYPYVLEQRNLNMAIPFVSIRFGNAILSKYPIHDPVFLDYPNPSEIVEVFSGGYKEGVVASIRLPDGSTVRVAPIHLCVSSQPIRIASIHMVLEAEHQSPLPLIVMGDFNARIPEMSPPRQAEERRENAIDVLLKSQQVTTRLPGVVNVPETFTFPSEHPDRVIDWVFVSSTWQVQDIRVLHTPLSDHLPVVAVLTKNGELHQ